jgi:flagellar biosynthesis protein
MNEKPDKPAVAVALSYPGAGAPKVTAKGHGETAERILELANEHEIPLWQDAGLAGVLAQVDLGDEIPEALYTAVSEVIAFAWRLRDITPPPE